MNKDRRDRIAKAIELLEEIGAEINELKDEEQDAYDNLPENFQDADQGSVMAEAIDNLELAAASVEEAGSALSDIE